MDDCTYDPAFAVKGTGTVYVHTKSINQDIQDVRTWKQVLREWHESRMRELGYPPGVQAELRGARERWLGAQPDERV